MVSLRTDFRRLDNVRIFAGWTSYGTDAKLRVEYSAIYRNA